MSQTITRNLSVGAHTITVSCSGYDSFTAIIYVASTGLVSCRKVVDGGCNRSTAPGLQTSGSRVTVYMKAKSGALTCRLTADFRYTVGNRTVKFTNRSAVSGSGCKLTEYYWDFGDGDEEFMASPTHEYPRSDRAYTVRLDVYDNAGHKKSITKTIRTESGTASATSNTKKVTFVIPDGAILQVS